MDGIDKRKVLYIIISNDDIESYKLFDLLNNIEKSEYLMDLIIQCDSLKILKELTKNGNESFNYNKILRESILKLSPNICEWVINISDYKHDDYRIIQLIPYEYHESELFSKRFIKVYKIIINKLNWFEKIRFKLGIL